MKPYRDVSIRVISTTAGYNLHLRENGVEGTISVKHQGEIPPLINGFMHNVLFVPGRFSRWPGRAYDVCTKKHYEEGSPEDQEETRRAFEDADAILGAAFSSTGAPDSNGNP